jgi:GNAT superfamily N-acetyltransferase
VLPARKVDLTGRIALQIGKGNVATGPAEVLDFFHGAELSAGGCAVFAMPSRNQNGKPNIRVSVEEFPNQFSLRESIDMVVSEYGIASLKGCTIRQRAQALIDIAHPDDRPELIDNAKTQKIIYEDQIYLAESAHLYPAEITTMYTFKGGVKVRFRAIKPSDEEEMRRLFYRFSDMAVYSRYFGHISAMPHTKTQEYVNVDWSDTLSIVGLVGETGHGRIIAEARFIKELHGACAEIVFVVDEKYQSLGIGTYLYKMLTRLAKERGLQGFTADVLFSNIGMMKIFRKGELPVKAVLENGVYHLTIPFEDRIFSIGRNIH